MSARAFAPAKVNLYLHVGPPGQDGFHPLESLMVFADVGDWVAISEETSPPLQMTGPFAAGLGVEDNLVLRAVRLLSDRLDRPGPAPALRLDKHLPLASGLGGGSADAAVTLRLLNRHWGEALMLDELEVLAGDLGSDVPACIRSQPVTASGRGQILGPAPWLPDMPAVLVNPGVACPTGAVYRAYDEAGPRDRADPVPDPGELSDVVAAARWLATLRNDLERPAAAVAPLVTTLLGRLRNAPETLLARLSGSGATAFALCPDAAAARRLAATLALEHPDWWVRPCRLGAPLENRP
jgi:4-diphosphocytidyl-2-C-methyl-D-erythritol kinase